MTGFYKANGKVGSTALFWADGGGYNSDIDKAEIFTKEDAQADVDNGWLRGDDEFPLSVKCVNELAEWRIDHQYVKKTYPEFTDPNDEYVVYKTNTFDGNDLSFGIGIGWSFNYSKAAAFSHEDADSYIQNNNPNMVFVPKYHADEIARRTFQAKNINRRKMISGAGIIGLRKKRRRQTTGKNRTNCVVCGKIVWDYIHPDMQITCGRFMCESDYELRKRGLIY